MARSGQRYQAPEDDSLVADLCLRRREAVETLARVHGRFIFNVAFRITGSTADAEDIVQETLLRAWNALPASGTVHLRGWLATVATRLALNELRRRGRHPASPLRSTPQETTGLRPAQEGVLADMAPLADPYRAAAAKLSEHDAIHAIENLPVSLRAAMVLRALHGLDYAEIGAALGCSAGAARVKVHRARQHCSRTLLAPVAAVPEVLGCGSFRRRIEAWAAGELSAEEAGEVAAHVFSCELCKEVRERTDTIRSTWALVPLLAWSVHLPALDATAVHLARLRLSRMRHSLRSLRLRRALLGETARHGVVGHTYDLIHLNNITMEDIAPGPVGAAALHVHAAPSPYECLSSTVIKVFAFDGRLFLHDGDQGPMCSYGTWEIAPAGIYSPTQVPAVTATSPRPAVLGAALTVSGRRFGSSGLVQLVGYTSTASGPVYRPPLRFYGPDRAVVLLPVGLRAGHYDVLVLTHAGAAATTSVWVSSSASTTGWQQEPSPTTATLRSVSCVAVATSAGTTTSYCYAVGDGGTIVFSDDGGLLWRAETSPTRVDLRGISCYRLAGPGLRVPLACWAVGDGGTILFEKDGLPFVATSTTPASTDPFESVACQESGQRCWAVGEAVAAELNPSLLLGWRLITILGPDGSQCGPGGPQNACLNGVALASNDEHFAGGGGGNVYAQLDYQGQAWSNQVSLGAGYFTSIACFPDLLAGQSRCITVGTDDSLAASRIYLTSDSGANWVPAASPAEGSLPPLRGVAVLRGSIGLAWSVGDNGTILRSDDAGSTWVRETSPTRAGLEAVSCPATSGPLVLCVAVGQGGTILALR